MISSREFEFNSTFDYYNLAVFKMLDTLLPGRVVYAPVEIALSERFRQLRETEGDAAVVSGNKLRFISVYHKPRELTAEDKRSSWYSMMPMVRDADGKGYSFLEYSLPYEIELWADTESAKDEMDRELMFILLNTPSCTINLPKPCPIRLWWIPEGSVDNSDVSSFLSTDRVYRQTVSFRIPQAFSFSSNRGMDSMVTDFSLSIFIKGELQCQFHQLK